MLNVQQHIVYLLLRRISVFAEYGIDAKRRWALVGGIGDSLRTPFHFRNKDKAKQRKEHLD
jgi:hypothetical protein